jgi:hypothetical protein
MVATPWENRLIIRIGGGHARLAPVISDAGTDGRFAFSPQPAHAQRDVVSFIGRDDLSRRRFLHLAAGAAALPPRSRIAEAQLRQGQCAV